MKKLKPYNVAPDGLLYKVRKLSEVSQKLIDVVGWDEKHIRIGFDFKPMPLPAKPPQVRVSRKYSSRLACYSPGLGLKTAGKPCQAPGIEARPPKSLSELKKTLRISYRTYVKQWGKLTPTGLIRNYSKYEREYPKKITALLIFKKGRLAGVVHHIKTVGVLRDKQNLITWYALVPGLTAGERAAANYLAALWLKKTTSRRISTLVELFERDSFKFFSGLGFITRRIIFERQ